MDFSNLLSACGAANVLVWLVGQGPIVAFLVNKLKAIEFVKQKPMVVAAAINLLIVLTTGLTWCGFDVAKLLEQFLVAFSGSVAGYEVAKRLGLTKSTKDEPSTPLPPPPPVTPPDNNWPDSR